MSIPFPCRRRESRYPVAQVADARIEFRYPTPDDPLRSLPLNDLSAAGISFVLDAPLPQFEPGMAVAPASVVVADDRVGGEMVVMHVTPTNDKDGVCGALFYPEDDAAIDRLLGLLTHLGRPIPTAD